MYLRILAFDLDGTLAHDGIVTPESWEALRRARDEGFTLMLVTGRRLETFLAEGPFAELFESIIAEDGAVVYFTRNNEVNLPFGRLDKEVIQQLESMEIPFERGKAIIATWMPHIDAVERVLHETGRSATIEYNKGAVMLLPPGATKGTGLRFALDELGYSEHNVIACGDAENDRSLFEVAEYSVAPSNANPEIKDLSDLILPYPNGKGVRHLIDLLSRNELPVKPNQNTETGLSIGFKTDGNVLKVQPERLIGGNLGVFGESGSGKSWLAGLLAERLLEEGYQLCIIDPEGDYSALRAFPHTLVLGNNEKLPPLEEVIALIEYTDTSLILDLSRHETSERSTYVADLTHSLLGLRARRGRPHWFLFDEIHNFCPPEGSLLTDLIVKAMKEKGVGVVSYRPSLVSPAILDGLDTWLVKRMRMQNEIDQLKKFLPNCNGSNTWFDQLAGLAAGDTLHLHKGLENSISATKFRVSQRKLPHVRHLHKYLRAPLPHSKRFYFRIQDRDHVQHPAASLWDFREAVESVPVASLKYHLDRKDFERWSKDVFHDEELARRLRKVRRRNVKDNQLREELKLVVAGRYDELESLI